MNHSFAHSAGDGVAALVGWLDDRPELIAAAAVVFILIAIALLARSRGRAAAIELAELRGRLSALSDMGAQRETDRYSGLSERMDQLSRQVADTLERTGERLGANVAEAGRRTWEGLSSLNERLALIDDARQSLAALSSEVGSLHGVLADKQARGAFGQVRMETIVRDALPSGAFQLQPTLSNGRRPDCLIRLPDAAPLVVDAKFPLEGFEALRAAREADARKAAERAIREAVARHIDDIAGKYLIPGETQDTALMFVPSEWVYAELNERFPEIVQRAHRARVMITGPNVLMLAVQTVQSLLKDARIRDHADMIQREVGRLLVDVKRLLERVAEVERHFALSGRALEKVSATAAAIGGRSERLSSLDIDLREEDEPAPARAPAARAPLPT